jgi:toxin ParE1/3/4
LNRIRWTPAALADFQAVSAYIETQSGLAAANGVCRVIYDAVQVLRRFPESGRPGGEMGTRELVVAEIPSYIVIYRFVGPDGIQILRIWHGAQDWR